MLFTVIYNSVSKHLGKVTTIILKERIFESEHFVAKIVQIIFSGISTVYLASVFKIDHYLRNSKCFQNYISLLVCGRIN